MKKLRVEELSVESFETSAPEQARGTVMGHSSGTTDGCLCASAVSDCTEDCSGDYSCKTTMSMDYTFCETMCC